jgi:hypothetical protein
MTLKSLLAGERESKRGERERPTWPNPCHPTRVRDGCAAPAPGAGLHQDTVFFIHFEPAKVTAQAGRRDLKVMFSARVPRKQPTSDCVSTRPQIARSMADWPLWAGVRTGPWTGRAKGARRRPIRLAHGCPPPRRAVTTPPGFCLAVESTADFATCAPTANQPRAVGNPCQWTDPAGAPLAPPDTASLYPQMGGPRGSVLQGAASRY